MALTVTQLRRLRADSASQGNRLKLAREMKELTQVELAEEIGITQSSLSDLERQRYGTTTVETAHKFADFFGCAIEDLFPAREAVKAS